MHIEPVTQTFTVTLTRKEMQLIAYGLSLHATNPGTVAEKAAQCVKMAAGLTNSMKLVVPPNAKNKG